MDKSKIQTLKGFRDFLPSEAMKRQYVINALKKVFESFGFEPLETPALEYEEILLGKYGEEGDKLMYRFEDNGKRRVALRYDQTVPLARVAAQHLNQLPTPFKRYQIQPVWRAENTQKGRFREFLQCDIDTVGLNTPLADAEIINCVVKSLESLGFKDFKVLINDRKVFEGIPIEAIRILDKLKKIGKEAVMEQLKQANLDPKLVEQFEGQKPTKNLENILKTLENLGISKEKVEFSPALARGLDYYTGMIIEAEIQGYEAGSVAGGGRFDNLIGMFAQNQIPAVGLAFGFDRIMEAMEQFNLFPQDLTTTKVLVTIFSQDLQSASIQTADKLRHSGINTELWLDPTSKLEKQLKYADLKRIPYALILGPEEVKQSLINLKNMKDKSQQTLSLDEITSKLTSL